MAKKKEDIYRRAERFVDREIFLNVSDWMRYARIMAADSHHNKIDCPVDVDDYSDVDTCYCCKGDYEDCANCKDGGGICNECDEGEIFVEVYEWYAVSKLFARHLERHGGVILRGGYAPIWGRTTTGQSVALDEVVQQVVIAVEENVERIRRGELPL